MTKPYAVLNVPERPEYPYEIMHEGVKALGFEIRRAGLGELLVTWSPWQSSPRAGITALHHAEERPVIVAENGWLSPIKSEPYYQLALDGWNGTGRFVPGDAERWASWGIEPLPWRRAPPQLLDEGPRIALIAGQRGHPRDRRTAVYGWHEQLGLSGYDEVIRRPRDSKTPLAEDLARADVVHVWTSNLATAAILAGIPVVQHGPNLMLSELASRPGEPLRYPERLPALQRCAWGQWNEKEIRTGAPFINLLALSNLERGAA